MITKNMISNDLVHQIYAEISGVGPTVLETVRETLAWLANNPIEPTREQIEPIYEAWLNHRQDDEYAAYAAGHGAVEFQRIAYLKKEEPLPQELTDLMEKPFDKASFTECWNERLIQAYKLGKKESK